MVVKTENELKDIIAKEKENGKSVLIKKGVFDIIHPGHVYAIGEFTKKADVVVILIQSDEFTSKKKGKERPINHSGQRALVIDGIKGVDYVYEDKSNSREEYIAVLKNLEPTILAITADNPDKSKDYSGYSWKLVEFPDKNMPGFSTTEIINRVLEHYS